MLLDQLAQFLLSGLTSGSIYALVAVGLCIILDADIAPTQIAKDLYGNDACHP